MLDCTHNQIGIHEMRQQCGSVYTWNCAGELYGIECSLCEERPLCAFSEFPEHMDVWHSDWQASEVEDHDSTSTVAISEDELMQEVLAEQRSNGEDNELKQQLVQQLNAVKEAAYLRNPRELLLVTEGPENPVKNVFNRPEKCEQFIQTPTKVAEIRKELNERPSVPDSTMQEVSPVVKGHRLTTHHVHRLIDLYRSEPRLWNQTHEQFHNMELCRDSWRRITNAWSSYCGRSFSVTDVRIRVSTLCQRFLKQRERLEADGELEDVAKFAHFDQLSFLCEQQSLLKRQRHYARENSRLLELYEHYPVLWHNAHKRVRCAKAVRQRHDALLGLQMALRLSGISLSPVVIQRRLQSLRKRYRLEKISYLQSVVGGKQDEFVSEFEHYAEMEFLHKHIDPYVCAVCGKIFENLVGHQTHVQSSCEVIKMVKAKDQEMENHIQEVLNEEKDLFGRAIEQSVEIFKEKLEEPLMNTHLGTIEVKYRRVPSLAEACAAAQLEDSNDLDTSINIIDNDLAEERLPLRLTIPEAQDLIRLYRSHVCLWDPNHLDYHSRKQRRLAWQTITGKLKSKAGQRLSWQTLHRKITDFTKYYRKERQRKFKEKDINSNWNLFDEFHFLDDVLPISSEIQKNGKQRDSNLKIITVYQGYAQLWCTDHPDYTKRRQRQRHLESLCTRLQEECNLQMTLERLKSRLIEFRCQYRHCKEARMAAENKSEPWTPNYEFYEPLRFLELHVAPFQCPRCPDSFKRRTDYLQHERKVHGDSEKFLDGDFYYLRRRKNRKLNEEDDLQQDQNLAHICHICGLKFSQRNSLLAHLRRHLGQRTHVCTDCPKKFFSSTALRVHQRSHTKELPYVCEHCARGFVNASKLNQHVKRHRNQRDFSCNRCDKAFYTAHERDRHLRAHLNIRDKVCPYCSRAFVVGSAYYAHLNLHRSEKRYACEACGKRFAQYAGLYKHRRRCLPAEVMEE
ncbi:uncharacterized protein LOC6539102 isoform X3 [Drosophila yakuba]|uniref:Uncharacterized protein, isoform C n=1 Tax=Drosophila yakuba TaxID=7245 RepID=A0A0R1E789_DROYA|nr:uncharacterized protein LOC6539102 isoform X3 [Drosophila yakuba]KRK05037.1 uncharacterized protein Dyak_GE15250, isoform C [Drosophila yakuba]